MIDFTFSGTQVLLGGAMLTTGMMAAFWIGRYLFNRQEAQTESHRTKYAEVDIFRWQPTFFKMGLICAMSFCFLAFNWTQYEEPPLVLSGAIELDVDLDMVPPITKHKPPPPPPPPPPKIEAVDDTLLLNDTTTFISRDIHPDDGFVPSKMQASPPPPTPPAPPPPPVEEIGFVLVAEEMPLYGTDCKSAGDRKERDQCSTIGLLGFINKRVKYPSMASEVGASGTAVVRFVVEKDGSMSSLEVIRDPGAGLGEEALRVVQMLAKEGERWTPGKQRGRPVRVQFNLPVKFRLE